MTQSLDGVDAQGSADGAGGSGDADHPHSQGGAGEYQRIVGIYAENHTCEKFGAEGAKNKAYG